MTIEPYGIKPLSDGVQHIYRFPNGFGASVIQTSGSYGGAEGLWELYMIQWWADSPTAWDLVRNKTLFPGVLGWLDDIDLQLALEEIKALAVPAHYTPEKG